MGKVGTQQLNINTILVKVKRGLKEAKRPNFFSWSKGKKRSQNRVIWFETRQVNNPDIMGSRSHEIIRTPNLKNQTNYLFIMPNCKNPDVYITLHDST